MNLFEQIYKAANRLREMSVYSLSNIFKRIDINFEKGNGNNIMKKGSIFASLINDNIDNFTDDNGNRIEQNDFLLGAFNYAKRNSNSIIELNHYKNLFYYFFLGMGKTFKIDQGYKIIPKRDFNSGRYKKVEVSDRVALDLMLTDYFDDSEHLLTTTEKENQLLLRNLRDLKAGKIKF